MMKKLKLALPFPLFVVFFYLYSFLDGAVIVNVFGCGCSENAFNANDFRWVVYALLTAAMTLLSVWLSKSVSDRIRRVLYCVLVFLIIGSLSFFICRTMIWK